MSRLCGREPDSRFRAGNWSAWRTETAVHAMHRVSPTLHRARGEKKKQTTEAASLLAREKEIIAVSSEVQSQ